MGGRNICLTILHSMVKGEPGIFPLLSENPWSVSVAHSPLARYLESYLAVTCEAITGENMTFHLSVWPQ